MFKVIIVEDDPMVAMINKKFISKNKKFEIAGVFKSGKSALEFLENNLVDLAILDVFMPVMDGFETLKEIRKNQIPIDVIMVTAANDTESIEEALHLGIVDYLVKPFTFDRFQIALEKFVSQKEAFESSGKLNQKNIDLIMGTSKNIPEENYPKGIQEKTLGILLALLNENKGKWFDSETIAKETGLTPMTVRRYMNYLETKGKVMAEMNYETGGRPCMLYCIEE